MLRPSQERLIERVANDLTGELPLAGTDLDRHSRMRADLLRASGTQTIQMEWGNVLPNPEVSFTLLERLAVISPVIARLSLKLTVDELQGCWALPLAAEYDSKNRARYPTLYDVEQKKQGVLAHRYVWRTLINPDIEPTVHLDHLCRTHACCNLVHLEAATSSMNTKRGNYARRIIGGQDPLFHPE